MNLKIFQARLDDQHLHADQEEINSFMSGVTVRKTSTQFVPGDPDYWSVMVFYENEKPKNPATRRARVSSGDHKAEKPQVPSTASPEKSDEFSGADLTEEEKEIESALRQWRKDRASSAGVPDFFVCHNAHIVSLAKLKPRTMEELSRVKGFGEQKVAKYGDDIIAVLNAF